MSALGALVVKIALEHAEFTKGLDKSSQEALRFAKNTQSSIDRFEREASSAFNNVAKSAGGAVVALLSVSTVINKLSQSFQFADQINDIAKANEVAVASVLKLSQALSLNGGNAEDASKLLTALTASIDQAAQGSEKTQQRFASLGISLNDLRKLDGEQILDKTLQSLVAINDPLVRNAAAMDLLGKGVRGVDIKGLGYDFATNQKNFDEAEKSFKDIGETFDKLDTASATLKTSLATLFGPTVLSGVQSFSEYVDAINFTMANGSGFEKFRMLALGNMSQRLVDLQKRYPDRTDLQSQSGKIKFFTSDSAATGADIRTVIDPVAEEARRVAERAAEKAAQDAKQRADKAAREAKERYDAELKAIQDMVDEELEATDAINSYKMKKQEELADAQKKLDEEELKRKERVMDILQDQATRNFDEAQRQQKELAEDAKRQVQDLSRSLTDALLRTFEAGEGGAKAFLKNLANIFKARVFQVGIEFVLSKSGLSSILATFSALLSGTASASAGSSSGGGVTSIFSSIKDLFSGGNNSIVGAIENLGAFLSTGNGGLGDTIGGFLGQYSSQIADGFGYFGAALQLAQGNVGGALGAGVGTFFGGPVGGAIGSFLGGALGGLFGSKLPPRIYSAQNTSIGADGKFIQSVAPALKGSWKSGGANDALGKLNESVLGSVSALFKSFGQAGNLTAFSAVSKKKSADAGLVLYLDGEKIAHNYTGKIKKGSIQQAFDALVASSYKAINEAVANSDLSEGVKKFFKEINSNDAAVDAVNTLVALNQQLEYLPAVFNAVRNAIDTTAYTTSIDALKAQVAATQNFVNLFYTDAEKFGIFTNQINTQLAALNQTMPASRDAYRELVESINVVDAATRDQFNGLVALAPAMNEYFNQLQQQADGINEVNQALADGLDRNLFSTYADYVSGKASVANGLSANGFIGDLSVKRADSNAELTTTIKSLVAQQARTEQILAEIAESTRKTREINERWNGDGLPETRVI